MPGDCPASLHILLFVCGKHSAPSRTPFRYQAKTVRLATGIGVQLQTGMLFGFTTEWRSASDRNRVHLRPDSPCTEDACTEDVCSEDVGTKDRMPDGAPVERGWVALKLEGPFPFLMTGVLASFVQPLAEAQIPIFAISTFDTDYVLIKRETLEQAVAALHVAGHEKIGEEVG